CGCSRMCCNGAILPLFSIKYTANLCCITRTARNSGSFISPVPLF
ncbi:FIG01046987: hypothetical protein, partial [Salmonella enterica subsp. enterica serovar Rissen]